jgi:hypothetical protein
MRKSRFFIEKINLKKEDERIPPAHTSDQCPVWIICAKPLFPCWGKFLKVACWILLSSLSGTIEVLYI